jgi:hypothetical protein
MDEMAQQRTCKPENMKLDLNNLPADNDARLRILGDRELVTVLRYIENHSDFSTYLGLALRDAFDAVVDFPNTGRRLISDPEVQSNEKTFVGTKMEKRLEALLGIQSRGRFMDLSLGGIDVDVKFSMSKFNGWMIPTEAIQPENNQGHLCLCIFANDETTAPKYDTILIRASKSRVGIGKNQDQKHSFKASAILDEAVLIHSRQTYRPSVLARLSTVEVDELFPLDGAKRLVRAIQMLYDRGDRVTLHHSDILLLGRGSRADAFIDAISGELISMGIRSLRNNDGSLSLDPTARRTTPAK